MDALSVVVFGATGMVGSGVLAECLGDPRVRSVLVVGRTPCGVSHPKLREVVRSDLLDWSDAAADLGGLDACFFCLGVSSFGMSEADYRRVTYDITVAAATALAALNPGMTFCYVSGEGTDSSASGRVMWARVKGETENRLLAMPLNAAMFRPGLIRPVGGARSKTRVYRAVYAVLGPLFPLLQRLLPRHVTTTAALGRAMILAAMGRCPKRALENPDINALAAAG